MQVSIFSIMLLAVTLHAMPERVPFEQLLPRELWSHIASFLPATDLFVHQLMYLKKEDQSGRFCLTDPITHSITDALEQRIKQVLYIPERKTWQRKNSAYMHKYEPDQVGYTTSHKRITDKELRARITQFMQKLQNLYISAPAQHHIKLRNALWKSVAHTSDELTFTLYARNYDYTKYKYCIPKPLRADSSAFIVLLMLDNNFSINPLDYQDMLNIFLPTINWKTYST